MFTYRISTQITELPAKTLTLKAGNPPQHIKENKKNLIYGDHQNLILQMTNMFRFNSDIQ